MVRPCDAVKALGSPGLPSGKVAAQAADLRKPKQVAPRTFRYGFAPERPWIVYVDPATHSLQAVSPAGGPARTLSAKGQQVTSWQPGREPGRVQYEAGPWFEVSLDEPAPAPASVTPRPLDAHALELRQAGVKHVDSTVRVSERYAAVTIVPPGGEWRLHAYDAQTGELRPLLPRDLRMEWSPIRVDDRRVILRAGGRFYLSDVVTAELACVTAALPEGFSTWSSYAVTSDARYLVHAAYREESNGARTLVLNLADMVEGTDTVVRTFSREHDIQLRAVPGTSRVVFHVRRSDRTLAAPFHALDPPGTVLRLTAEVPRMDSFDVSSDGKHLVFARGIPWNGPPLPPKPEVPRRTERRVKSRALDGDEHRPMTCDPIRHGQGACGWVSNGCGDYTWAGFCPGTEPKPPPMDATDGLYVFSP